LKPFARRTLTTTLLALAAATIESRADAQARRTFALSWVASPGTEGCGSGPAVAGAIESRLGRHSLVSLSAAEISIEVQVARIGEPARWHAVVAEHDAAGVLLGTRDVDSHAADCTELRESLVLVVALMVEDDAEPAAAPRTQPAARVEAEPTTPQAPPVASPHERLGLDLGASGALSFGLLPAIAPGLVVRATVSPPSFWTVEAFGSFWAPETVLSGSSAMTQLSLASGGIALCPLAVEGAGRRALRLCAGGQVGVLRTIGVGFAVTHRGTVPTADVLAGGDLQIPVAGPLAIRLGLELDLALRVDQIVYDDQMGASHEIFERSVVALSSDLGLSASLP
jgi:hypothetical protein